MCAAGVVGVPCGTASGRGHVCLGHCGGSLGLGSPVTPASFLVCILQWRCGHHICMMRLFCFHMKGKKQREGPQVDGLSTRPGDLDTEQQGWPRRPEGGGGAGLARCPTPYIPHALGHGSLPWTLRNQLSEGPQEGLLGQETGCVGQGQPQAPGALAQGEAPPVIGASPAPWSQDQGLAELRCCPPPLLCSGTPFWDGIRTGHP